MTIPAQSIPLPCTREDIEDFLSTPQEGSLQTLQDFPGDILVLGAGGKMGLHLCLMLQKALKALGRNDTVYAASRFQSLNSTAAYTAAGIETIAGDFRDSDFRKSLPRCPTVFYLVGAKFGTSHQPGLLQAINVDLAADLAAEFRDSTIVAFSTGCVYSFVSPESGGATESSETKPVGDYALSCLGREDQFTAASKKWGTPVALIRLNYAVEFRYGVLVDIAQKLLAEEAIDLSTGYVNLIWQADALNQIIQCLPLAQSPARPINITGPGVLKVEDLAQRFAKRLGKRPVFSGQPEPTAWLSNAAESHSRFGLPEVSVDQMIDWISAWLAQGGTTHGKPTGFEKRDGKF
ncbi:MAG: NAD(P)-dependent oxidoreductase [Opitutales bacterium]|nr:NAD(P)-dependent oxidoreductase [Opitutales bacterium]